MKLDFHWLIDPAGKRIAGKGQKHTVTVNLDSKTCITVLSCVNTAGYAIPSLVIYACANLTKPLYQWEIPGKLYALSPGSGWMDDKTFHELSMLHLADLYCSY